MKRPTTKTAVLSALVSVLLLGAIGCSDDGVDTGSSDTTAAKPATSAPAEESEEDDEETEVFDPDGAGMSDDEEEQDQFAGDFMGEVEDETEDLSDDTESYSGYVELSDDTGALYIEVPEEFTDVNTQVNEAGLPQIDASTDLQGFVETWGVPGITYTSFGADTEGYGSSQEAFDTVEGVVTESCTLDASETFTEDNLDYTVGYYLDCAGTDTDYGLAYIFLGADLPILSVQYQLTSIADGEAFETALASFNYDIDQL